MTARYVKIRFEDAQRIFDAVIGADSACSGYMESDDVAAMRRLASALGVDPTRATPAEFVPDYPHQYLRRTVRAEPVYVGRMVPGASPDGRESVEAQRVRMAEERADLTCQAGSCGRRCGKPENDELHTTKEGT